MEHLLRRLPTVRPLVVDLLVELMGILASCNMLAAYTTGWAASLTDLLASRSWGTSMGSPSCWNPRSLWTLG